MTRCTFVASFAISFVVLVLVVEGSWLNLMPQYYSLMSPSATTSFKFVSVKRALICIPAPSRLHGVMVALVAEILPLALSHSHRQDPLRHAQTARYFSETLGPMSMLASDKTGTLTQVWVMVWRRCALCIGRLKLLLLLLPTQLEVTRFLPHRKLCLSSTLSLAVEKKSEVLLGELRLVFKNSWYVDRIQVVGNFVLLPIGGCVKTCLMTK